MTTKPKKHEERSHSVFAASSSKRWFNCPGSVRRAEKLPKPPSSKYADEGTAAHELGEKCLRDNKNPEDFLGTKITVNGKDWPVNNDMVRAVKIYVDRIRELSEKYGAKPSLEERFDLSWLYPGLYGTNDASIRQDFGVLYIGDYKHGAGQEVDAEENTQALYYAVGAAYNPKLGRIDDSYEKVIIEIIQPRCRGEAIKTWETTIERVIEFSNELRERAKAADKEDAPLLSGDHCLFCPCKAQCPEVHNKAQRALEAEFGVPTLPSINTLTNEQIVKVIESKKLVVGFIEACEDWAYNELLQGKNINGLKLVRGRGSRAWTKTEEEVESILLEKFTPDQIFESGLKSVSKLEEVLGKAALKGLWQKVEGGLKVAPLTDKGESVDVSSLEDKEFKALDLSEF